MALARLGDFSWFHASWWPWWGAGSPLEYTYAPFVPMLTAWIARRRTIPLRWHSISYPARFTA